MVKLGEKPILLVLLAMALLSFYIFWQSALQFESLESARGGLGYVSDETWYVSASRVILTRVFKLEPKQEGTHGATIVLHGKPSRLYLSLVTEQCGAEVRTYYARLVNTTLTNKTAIYITGSYESLSCFVQQVSKQFTIETVIPGWPFPDRENVHVYLNPEHPPLGKYLIALSMLLLGDRPVLWRVPVIMAGVLTAVLLFLALEDLTKNLVVALTGAGLLLLDPLSRAMFSISMLDGFVALFTTMSLYVAIKKRYQLALVLSLVGGLFKATGLFAAIPVVLLLSRNEVRKRDTGGESIVKLLIYSFSFYASVAILLYMSFLVLASLPLMHYTGVAEWFRRSVTGSITWHLSVKCVGPECPISSTPWDWFLGSNSFPLYVYPDGRVLRAVGIAPLWLASLVLLILSTPAVFVGRKDYGYIALYYYGVLCGYILIWLLGGRSQYSFYSIHLAPLVYANLAYIFGVVLPSKSILTGVLGTWYKTIEAIARKLLI